MPGMSRERFLCEFEYDVEKEFDVSGAAASWADTDQKPAHRYWGHDDYRIELPYGDHPQYRVATSALSLNKELIVASNGFVVDVYDIATRQCRMKFRGLIMPARVLLFYARLRKTGVYTLIISSWESDRPDSGMSLIF